MPGEDPRAQQGDVLRVEVQGLEVVSTARQARAHPSALRELVAQRLEVEVSACQPGYLDCHELPESPGGRHVDEGRVDARFVTQCLPEVQVHRAIPADVLVHEGDTGRCPAIGRVAGDHQLRPAALRAGRERGSIHGA